MSKFYNTLLMTHAGCMDGSTCATLFRAAGGDPSNIAFSHPGYDSTDSILRDLLESFDGFILIADLSISYEMAKSIDGLGRVKILDHHKSAIPLGEFDWCDIDVENSRCGSRMLFDFIQKEMNTQSVAEYRDLVDLSDDYDRWQKQYALSTKLNEYHNSVGQRFFIERFIKNSKVSFTENEKFLLKIEKGRKERYIKSKRKKCVIIDKNIDGNDLKIAFVLSGEYQSSLGESLYSDPYLGVDAVVMVSDKSISFRAHPDCPLDLSTLAMLNGGGGHKKAAGCSLSNVLEDDLLDLVISNLKWN